MAKWNQLYEDMLTKFKNLTHFFEGHSKSLHMIDENPANAAVEDQAREEKPATTAVYDYPYYAQVILGNAENPRRQMNVMDRRARTRANATVFDIIFPCW